MAYIDMYKNRKMLKRFLKILWNCERPKKNFQINFKVSRKFKFKTA